MKKALLGFVSAGVLGYQGYSIYQLHNPTSNFRGGLQRLQEDSGAQDTPLQLTNSVSGLPLSRFILSDHLPTKQLSAYLTSSKSDFLYIDFREVQLQSSSINSYLLSRIVPTFERPMYTNKEGKEDINLIVRLIMIITGQKMTEHLTTPMTSTLAPAAVNEYIMRRLRPSDYEKFSQIRFPVIAVEGCETWVDAWERKTSSSEEARIQWGSEMTEIFRFLALLWNIRNQTHIILVSKKDLTEFMKGFNKWHEGLLADIDRQQAQTTALKLNKA